MKYEPYYNDVAISVDGLAQIPEVSMDISSMLHTIETSECAGVPNNGNTIDEDEIKDSIVHISSFMAKFPNRFCELEIIMQALELEDNTNITIDWHEMNSSPINEYNTEGLLDMEFPTLFPNGVSLQMQP